MVKSYGKGEKNVAAQTLKKIRESAMRVKKKPIRDIVAESFVKQVAINIRNMKLFLFTNFTLSTYEIENLIDYLDHNSDGFVPAQDFITEVERA